MTFAPHDGQRARLPEPIPASYYARPEGPPGAPARRWPAVRLGPGVFTIGTLAGGLLATVVLLGLVIHVVSAQGGPPAGQPLAAPVASASPRASTFTPVALVPTDPPTPTPRPSPTPTPSPTRTTVTFLNAPVMAPRGRTATVQVRTTPRAACAIVVGYPSAPKLDAAAANASGVVSWSWRVSHSAQAGTYPLTVTCGGVSGATQIVVS